MEKINEQSSFGTVMKHSNTRNKFTCSINKDGNIIYSVTSIKFLLESRVSATYKLPKKF